MSSDNLRKIPLFARLSNTEIKTLKESLREEKFQAGDIVFSEGTTSAYFYILMEGEVEIIKSLGMADERYLGINSAYSVIGEMSRFSQIGTHSASVRVHTQAKLLRVPFSWLETILQEHPDMALDLLQLYSSRLDHSENLTIKDLREKNLQLSQAYEELKRAQAAMIEKEKLEQEMRLASKIQRSILPKEMPCLPGLDFGAVMIPAKEVGGDFYDLIDLDEQRVGIVIGDVCDKGMPAALLMALTYSSVRMQALMHDSPGNTLRAVNRHLIQIDCSDMYVTLLYGILDYKTLSFEYARAGHPKPILLGSEKNSLPVPYRLGQAVGMFEEVEIDEEFITIPRGGSLIIYSDGLSETVEEMVDTPDLARFCSAVMRSEELSTQDLCERLWRAAAGSAGESMIKDDFTVVMVRSKGR